MEQISTWSHEREVKDVSYQCVSCLFLTETCSRQQIASPAERVVIMIRMGLKIRVQHDIHVDDQRWKYLVGPRLFFVASHGLRQATRGSSSFTLSSVIVVIKILFERDSKPHRMGIDAYSSGQTDESREPGKEKKRASKPAPARLGACWWANSRSQHRNRFT